MLSRAVTLVIAITLGTVATAAADEEIIPLAESGDWAAAAHHTSMTAPPDVCVAMNNEQGVAFRADAEGVQFRVSNTSWSLPTGVKGSISLEIWKYKKSLDINYNTSDVVGAEFSQDEVLELFTQMDNSSSMAIVVGKAKPFTVSLVGSTKATNAFRTCAGIKSNAPSPGSNPFD